VNLRLAGRPVLVVGGGKVAERKLKALVASGAEVTVVSPTATDQIANDPNLTWRSRPYCRGEVADYRLVVACTDDAEVNAQVYGDGEAAGVWTNSADDPQNCAFTLPSVVRRGDLQVAVSSNGRSPAVSAWLRRRLEAHVTEAHRRLLELCDEIRVEARANLGTSELTGWHEALEGGAYELVAAGDTDGARALIRKHLGLDATSAPDATLDSELQIVSRASSENDVEVAR